MTSKTFPVFRPYSRLARSYDAALGVPNFLRTRHAFRFLVRRYAIRFRSAADLGCGTGLFARYLAACWRVPVFAVDRSREMLRVARGNCCGSAVQFLEQDIRCLRLPQPVDLITANFDTLNHLVHRDEVRRLFCRVAENLRPGGWFIFDFVTPCQPLAGRRTWVRRYRHCGRELQQRIHWDPPRRLLSILIVERWAAHSPPAVEVHRERAYAPREIGRWLLDAGFVIRGVYDAATLRPARNCPSRLIVVVQARADHLRPDRSPRYRGAHQPEPQA
ncbi:MAG: methyltransferase domain-containing protein [Acidobacteriia bacterium]|nr:methyltransferase domain-containing protein [Terriglobia bacterium]